jgi:hypothetical protein
MVLRRTSSSGRGQVHVEVARPDELPAGEPGPARSESPSDRGDGGKFARGNRVASAGGRARSGATKLATKLGLAGIVGDATFAPYKAAADAFKRAHVRVLASTVGGGDCGPAPSSIVASAALQLAASRWAFDRGKYELGSSLANSSRQNLLAAHELCAREGEARAKQPDPDFWSKLLDEREGKRS